MNSYRLEASEVSGVVDKLTQLDLEAATSSEELAISLQRVAAFSSTAGVSMDKMLGILTAVSSTTRLSAETIGNGFKSILSRLQNVAAGKAIDDLGEPINDVEKVLNSLGISLRTTAGEFRDMEDVIDEMAEKWDTLSSVEQAQLATAAAGIIMYARIRVATPLI